MTFKNHYVTLGVAPTATQDQIKRADRKLARCFHPDVSHEPVAEERYKDVAVAHETLIDAERRQRYDAELAAPSTHGGLHGQAKADGNPASRRPTTRRCIAPCASSLPRRPSSGRCAARTSTPSSSSSWPTPSAAPRAAYAPPPRAMAEPEPLPVALVAPPPPVAMPAPVAVPLRHVSFAAESLFGFDSAELRAPGRSALDIFASELAGTRYDSIAVTGHTDRLGSTAYNQTLSLKRTDAVKASLISSAGLDAASISARGLNESRPVTQPGDCKGRSSPRVIACLQPYRRVEIQVSGTR